jgi:2-oxoglutarate ferredoxin oxidoreductase subunit beta
MLAVSAGATFVAQGFSSWQPQLASLIQKGIEHPGFSLINVISPCVTYNKVNTYDWYKQSLQNLDNDPDYVPNDRTKALARLHVTDELVTGLIYQEESTPYEDLIPGFKDTPLVHQNLHVDPNTWNQILSTLE